MRIALHDIPGGTRWADHSHDRTHLCAVIRGALVQENRGRQVELEEGMLRFSAPASHALRFGPAGARCLMIEFGDG